VTTGNAPAGNHRSEEERSHSIEEKASIIIKAWLNAAVLAAAKEGEGMTFDIKVRLIFNSC
jgi:hypothetical protein